MQTYINLLQSHDWYYGHSDDHRVWKAGQTAHDNLRHMQKDLDPDGSVWNEYCPDYFRMNVRPQLKMDIAESLPISEDEFRLQYPGCNGPMTKILMEVINDVERG